MEFSACGNFPDSCKNSIIVSQYQQQLDPSGWCQVIGQVVAELMVTSHISQVESLRGKRVQEMITRDGDSLPSVVDVHPLDVPAVVAVDA